MREDAMNLAKSINMIALISAFVFICAIVLGAV